MKLSEQKGGWWLPLGIVALLLLLIWGLPWALLHLPQELAIRRHVKALEAAGAPVTIEAATRGYLSLPEAENGADEFLRAFELMKDVSSLPEKRMLPRGRLTNVTKLLDGNRALYTEVHRSNTNFFLALETATQKYKRARYNLEFGKFLEMQIPHLPLISSAYTCIELDAAFASERGDTERLLKDVEMMLTLANSIAEEPLMLSAMVRTLGLTMAASITQLVLQNQSVEEQDLNRLEKAWGVEGTRKQVLSALRYERVQWKGIFRGPVSEWQKTLLTEDRDRSGEGWILALRRLSGGNKVEELFFLQRMRDLEGLIAGPPRDNEREQILELQEALEQERTRKTSGWTAVRNVKILTLMSLPQLYRNVHTALRSEATIRVVQIGLKLARNQMANSNLPQGTEELRRMLGEEMLTDPFSGEPMKWAEETAGTRIYSVGMNGADEGGVQSSESKTDDIGFFVRKKTL